MAHWHMPSKRTKYRNKVETGADGLTFHSKRERKRWEELKLMEKAGKIMRLERQVPIALGVHYDNGREAKLIVDFSYLTDSGVVYEDSKSGIETPVSKLKRALARKLGIEVRLV